MSSKDNSKNSAAANERIKRFEAKQSLLVSQQTRKVRDNRLAGMFIVGALVLASGLQFVYFNFGPGQNPNACVTTPPVAAPTPGSHTVQAPDPRLSQCRDWTGLMQINSVNLGITLHGKLAPAAVSNFVDLANNGFFSDVKCHRMTNYPTFKVLQCGDPKGDGTGGPGYYFGPIENAPADQIYKKGWIAMARQGNNATSMGSQFFIMYGDSKIPNDQVGGYTVFGEVSAGLAGLNPVFNGGIAGGKQDGKPKVAAVIKSASFN